MTALPKANLPPASPLDLIALDMAEVDAVIRRRLASDVALIDQIANYIIGAGGKRIRPMLVLLFAQALGFRGPERFELAATVEFIHTATLLHDDVVDESALRRGRDTANARFGNAASVLVGDFLYSRAFQMMVSVNRMAILEVLADAPGNTHLFTRTDAIDRVMSLGAAVTASAGARPLPVCSKLVVN